MKDKLLTKIDAIEKTFSDEPQFIVKIKLINGIHADKYEVLLMNKNFKEHESGRWMSTEFMTPLRTTDLNVALAEAAAWARFLGTTVNKEEIEH